MAFSRHLGVISILGASWLVALGCGDDGDKKVVNPGAGGEAGEGSGGGGKTSGGSANDAGKAGMSTAGKGGTGGGAGAGGESPAEVTAGAGGEMTTVPNGGAGGDAAGGAGNEQPPGAKLCANECNDNTDCAVGGSETQLCDLVTKRCYDSSFFTCQTREDCIPSESAWDVPCQADGDCADDGSQHCVSISGKGWCADIPGVEDDCGFLVATQLPAFGAQGKVKVCAYPYDSCYQGYCNYGCDDPSFGGYCTQENGVGNTCNTQTGQCDCNLGTECESTICGTDHRCAQCDEDSDCDAEAGFNVCVNGTCGCSAATVCPDATESATPVCE